MHPSVISEKLLERTAKVEKQVREAYQTLLGQRFPAGVALAAVGGFGRAEMFPHSDVDLLFLAAHEDRIPPPEALSAFLQVFWDSGLRPSHSIHTIEDCIAQNDGNVELTISLLDRRFLAGDAALFEELDRRFQEFIARRGVAVARRLIGLTESRRAKFQNTIFHLEPDIKEAPGALRDLQTVRWLAALRAGISPAEERAALEPAFEFLVALRIRLHELAGRDRNMLSFDAQETFSNRPEALMRDYFRHAVLIDRATRRAIDAFGPPGNLLGRFNEWRSRLSTTDFTVSRDRVLLRQPGQMPHDLSLFEFAARHELRLADDTIERLAGFTPQTTWAGWRRLLALPHASLGLRAMQDSGTLPAALPEWKHIESLVVRDFYHRYTVDEHTLVAIASLESIADPRLCGLFEEIGDPAPLRFALLMHDIGKGSGQEHVGESLAIARAVMERLGAPEEDRSTVEFLIERHLDLSSVMTSRDLRDGNTAQTLAARLGTLERLKLLTMLTYADISAVNPQAMTPWRLDQLWRVYLIAHQELTRELETERIRQAGGGSPERAAFLEGLPTRYLRTHTQAEIDAHFELSRRLESRPVAIEIAHERSIYRLTLLTHDKPRLFASVAGAISSFGLNILRAEAFSNAAGTIVDTFTFSDPHRTLELNPPELDRLRGIVRKVVEGKQDADKLLRGRPKPILPSRGGRLTPRVSFDDAASQAATLIEIVAQDRPGLLYDLASAISAAECNIEVVLIDTEAHRALDVFYVTAGGRKLDSDRESSLKTGLLAACSRG